jgi:DNA topoisomerase I
LSLLIQRLTVRQSKRRRTSGKQAASKRPTNGKTLVKAPETAVGDDSDSDAPIGRKLAKEKPKTGQRVEADAKAIRKQNVEAATKKAADKSTKSAKPATNGVRKQANGVKKEPKAEGTPISKASAKAPKSVKPESTTSAKKGKAKATPVKEETEELEGEEEEEEYRWWEDPTKGDGTIKWTTLEHNGVVFPPPYEPLPPNVKLQYDGVPVTLELDAEEVAGFFGSMLNSTHNVDNPTFQKNFFGDFMDIIKKTGGARDPQGNIIQIKEFAKCDFSPIFGYYEMKRVEKKNLPPAEKKAQKAIKEASEAPYMHCLWDGRKQKVGNFRIEPPGLFRGRGEHPKTGKVKARVQPEQITINIGKDAPVPPPPEGHCWKEIKHDQEGTWLAMWQENVNGNYKYVMLAANSDVKGQSDYKKFEKARELKKHIDRIRKDYQSGLKHDLMADRQRATAVYLIDKFALRAGNEKGEDEADTVGCCSLKFENVTLKPPNTVIFDFLGKDSIRFYDEVEVDPQVFKNLKIFKKSPKKDGDEIFDRLTVRFLMLHIDMLTQVTNVSRHPPLTSTFQATWPA